MRRWRLGVSALAVFAAVASGSSTATAAETAHRSAGHPVTKESATPRVAKGATSTQGGAAQATSAPQSTPVPLPDMGLEHRRPDGGINLFRMSVSDLTSDYGQPQRVAILPASSGFSYDRAKVTSGDFGDITSRDNGDADHVIWHQGSDGGIRVYGIGGGGDTRPRLWAVLPHTAGWTWSDSRIVAGDVNGDFWDDLVIIHKARVGAIVWVMLSDGTKLTAPKRWGAVGGDFATMRNVVADADADGNADILTTTPGAAGSPTAFSTAVLLTKPDGTGGVGASVPGQSYATADGWSFAASRQMTGDFSGDGLIDLVNVSPAPGGGIQVSISVNCTSTTGHVCWNAPTVWQTMPTWSFSSSRQYVADTNGDYHHDLVTVYRASNGGMYVWRATSTGTALAAPEQFATLSSASGWNFSYCRETVANIWGLM
jgi:hypothetical protein